MDWAEKEYRYQEQFRSGKQAKNIWKYIPASVACHVDKAFSDSDGYWIWLENDDEGCWRAYDGGEDCGIIHEYTIADLKDAIKTIRKVK